MVPPSWAELTLGQVPETVVLKGDLGGRLDGSPWSSDELKGKVSVLFYADPDEKDLNNETSETLRKENFPLERYQSFAIINMDATWLPNFAISSALKEKQEQYPNTIYVRDYEKVLVNAWGLSDDNNDVLAFDKTGKLIFRKDGKLNSEEIENLITAIRDNL
ncbi:MAG: YtfJ family protein [Thermodesulfobacteriota bacterium]